MHERKDSEHANSEHINSQSISSEPRNAGPLTTQPINTESTQQPSPQSPEELQASLGLLPHTIVLAKVKGYPPWPAMVLEEEILPENVRRIKPKTVRAEKKHSRPAINLPVQFFSDKTYIWIKSSDLKILTPDDIDEFLAKRARLKKNDLLVDAYRLAKAPPDMLASAEPDARRLKLSIKLNGTKKTAKGDKSTKNTKKSAKNRSIKEAPKYLDEDEPDYEYDSDESVRSADPEEYDSDWDFDDEIYDYAEGNYIFDDKDEQEHFVNEFPRAAELAAELEEYNEAIARIHDKIAPVLVEENVDDERLVVNQLRNLEKYLGTPGMPLVAFTKSPLYRVLLLTLHRPKELYPYESVRKAVKRLFQMLSLDPCLLTAEEAENDGTNDLSVEEPAKGEASVKKGEARVKKEEKVTSDKDKPSVEGASKEEKCNVNSQ
ncbi:hypothetical protein METBISCDRAFT_15038 [Metschnikowia bicuspidata]|uniref:PWWP domain-containing protein n=1 Tax=Metschnikowia bicuspidata TaxID=27322 RepID=A0A4P9ZG68_9ASCO|nr:hypothetical protein METBISCDRAFT_15038 [Metschnikowia bicuspidata]